MSEAALTLEAAGDLVTRALVASRTSQENARSVARALVAAETDGQGGHGLSRVPSYAAQARAGKIDGLAVPVVTQTRAASLMIDAKHGFAYPAFDAARARLVELAQDTGVAAAGFHMSSHAGALGLEVEKLAEAGLVAIAFANTPKAMAPAGGKRALLGTNPIAFAAPQRGAAPLVVDLALSEVARGKIMAAAQKGVPIPESWALDADGKPTTDAKAALAGTVRPLGGAKGFALAIMVEVLAAALVGARLSKDATSFFDDKGGPPEVGQLIVAIDPGALAGQDAMLDRIGDLASAMAGDGDARMPGTRRLALRERARREGLQVDAKLAAEIEALASG